MINYYEYEMDLFLMVIGDSVDISYLEVIVKSVIKLEMSVG
jgi:hypothetical protein